MGDIAKTCGFHPLKKLSSLILRNHTIEYLYYGALCRSMSHYFNVPNTVFYFREVIYFIVLAQSMFASFCRSEPRSPGIDSQPDGPLRQPYFSYRPSRLHRMGESIPRNRFLGSLNAYKYGLRANRKRHWFHPWRNKETKTSRLCIICYGYYIFSCIGGLVVGGCGCGCVGGGEGFLHPYPPPLTIFPS